MTTKPRILIVDDEPDSAEDLIDPTAQNLDVSVRHPSDVVESDLRDCAVVVVDHYLENWHELESQPPATRPKDGFALAAVLRSQLPRAGPGPAIVILTGKLEQLAGSLPPQAAQHLLAWQHDIEWVFSKSAPRLADRLLDMADAVKSFRSVWSNQLELENFASAWLALNDMPWKDVALDHILQTRPPIHNVSVETSGSSLLRWFLHRILPYPAFLTDIYWTATRLDVSADWLELELSKERGLFEQLAASAYSGGFSKFSGPRWWRAGLASTVVELTQGRPFDRQALREGVRALTSEEPEFLNEDHPVLAHDPRTMEATRVIDAHLAVQIVPDGWPVYADTAWASVEDIGDDPDLRDIVIDPSLLPRGSGS